MNAAARAINQSNVFHGHWVDLHFSKQFYSLAVLLCALLLSALAVIYVTNENRLSFSQLQELETQMQELQLQHGKLLLEQASLATPARVQTVAVQKLHMSLPLDKQTFVLQKK